MTEAYYSDEHVTLWHGDCLQVLRADELGYDFELGYGTRRAFPDASVDAVVTDPPYGIGFMGHQWDQPGEFGPLRGNGRPNVHRRRPDGEYERISEGAMEAGRYDLSASANQRFQAWCTAWATECLRVLKPGGYFVSFGGSRTWHRLAAAVEDAGFEIRDSIAWLYAQGFPKSLDVSKAIDAAAGAARPVVGIGGSVRTQTSMRGATAAGARGMAAHPEGPRITTAPATAHAERWRGWGTALKPSFEPIVLARKPLAGTVAANVLAHGTGALNIDACRVSMTDADAAAINAKHAGMDVEGYERTPGAALNLSTNPIPLKAAQAHDAGRWPTNVVLDEQQAAELDRQTGVSRSRVHGARAGAPGEGWGLTASGTEYEDAGGASRFFPVFRFEPKAPTAERPRHGEVVHPTVKPLDLMRWLVRLVTPTGGVVLEPFAGSGTTAEACVIEGFRCVAIEREAAYLPLIVTRLSKPIQVGLDFGEAS